MPTVAELFDARPATENAKTEQRRKKLFDEIAEAFTKELAPADEREWGPDWDYTTEGVPVKVYIMVIDTEWLAEPDTLLNLRTHLGFAPERNDVNLNVKMQKGEGYLAGGHIATLTLTKIVE